MMVLVLLAPLGPVNRQRPHRTRKLVETMPIDPRPGIVDTGSLPEAHPAPACAK